MKRYMLFVPVIAAFMFVSCEKDRGFNLFTVQQDMEFGDSMIAMLDSDPVEYPILPRSTDVNSNAYKAYKYLDGMKAAILTSDKFKYGNTFEWEIFIIDKPVMNAFATPGGKLFFYTGLINYLDNAASLAGVLGHEMAHSDLRHSTKVMTEQYGLQVLFSILAGNDVSQMEEIVGNLALGLGSLKFSRENEFDADRYAMYYLASTKYEPLGITYFFKKLQAEGKTDDKSFVWFSTHPSDQTRIDEAENTFNSDTYLTEKMAGKTYDKFEAEYNTFKSWLN